MEQKRDRKKRIRELQAELKELTATPRSDWHAGFEALLRIEMYRYGNRVRIETEYVLGLEPPRVDFLILTEEDSVVQEKEIFRIFRRHNVIEYKNPNDALNERTLFKTCGYANLYIGLAEHEKSIPPDQVTLSVFRASKPVKLFRKLKQKGQLENGETAGIYYVTGMIDVPFQIVITGELEGEEYAAYRALARHASEEDVNRIISGKEDEPPEEEVIADYYRVLLRLLSQKNRELFEKIGKESKMEDVLMDIMKDAVNKRVEQGMAQGIGQGIDNLADLYNDLRTEGRDADAERVMTDRAFRQKMLQERGVSLSAAAS